MNSSPTVVMIPGAGDNANVWAEVGSAVEAAGVRWVALDLPGRRGETDPHPGTVTGLAEWVGRRIESMDAGRVVLAGHSMGSMIAIEVAGRYPEIVDRLVLMCTGAPMVVSDFFLEPESPEALVFNVNRYSHSRDAEERFPDAIERHLAEYASLDDDTFTSDLRSCHEYRGACDAAERVAVPTTVVLAEFDVMVRPETADPIIACLAQSDVVMLEGVGHAIEDEAPIETARIIIGVATLR